MSSLAYAYVAFTAMIGQIVLLVCLIYAGYKLYDYASQRSKEKTMD